MSILEPVTTTITLAAVLKYGEQFLAAATGHKGESVATILGDMVYRRHQNAQTAMGNANLTLLNIGVKAGEIPFKILHGGLEGASLEEEPSMQDKWANLLANAADPRRQNPVEPIFTTILKEITTREAKFLDVLYDVARSNTIATTDGQTMLGGYELKDAFVKAGLTRRPHIGPLNMGEVQEGGEDLQQDLRDFSLTVGILIRVGLLQTETEAEYLDVSSLVRKSSHAPRRLDLPISTHYVFTQLAYRFVAACRPPEAS